MWEQVAHLTGTLGRQASQHIFHVGIRVMAIEFGRMNQTHDRCGTLSRAQ